MNDAALIGDLVRAGVDPDLVSRVANALIASASERQAVLVPDEAAEHRRANDRERKAIIRGNLRKSAESADNTDPSKVPPITPLNTPTNSEAIASSLVPRRKVGFRLPEDWQPSESDLSFSAEHNLAGEDRRIEIMKFKNHWAGKSGKDAAKLDWSATWRNWVLNGKKFNGERTHNGNRRSPADSFFAGLAEVAADIDGDHSAPRPEGAEIPRGRVNIDHR